MKNLFPAEILQNLAETRVVAGFSVDRSEHAVPLANALLAGGINAIELTLRTPAAMDGMKAICADVPGMLVGVGTILTPESAIEVSLAGADFGVAPGMNPRVIRAAQETGFPFAPGIATPAELEGAIELGCGLVKFFPAEHLGGVAYLRSMSAPYKHLGIQYFPLGGVNAGNMLSYLNEPNIPAVGGTWIVKNELVENEDWTGITARAQSVTDQLRKFDNG